MSMSEPTVEDFKDLLATGYRLDDLLARASSQTVSLALASPWLTEEKEVIAKMLPFCGNETHHLFNHSLWDNHSELLLQHLPNRDAMDAALSRQQASYDGGLGLLQHAVRYGGWYNYRSIKIMVSAGCDPCARNADTCTTPLHEAIVKMKRLTLNALLASPRLMDDDLKLSLLQTAQAQATRNYCEPDAQKILQRIKKIRF